MRSFTVVELEHEAGRFIDHNDASSNVLMADALKYRMFLSMFIVWIKAVSDKEDNVLDFQLPETTNGTDCKDDCHYTE